MRACICQQTIKGVEKVATPSTLFYAENAAILPLWVGMIVWPEEKITKAVMSTYAPVVVAAVIYMWLTYECFQVRMAACVAMAMVDMLRLLWSCSERTSNRSHSTA